jgi:hypothetical protein
MLADRSVATDPTGMRSPARRSYREPQGDAVKRSTGLSPQEARYATSKVDSLMRLICTLARTEPNLYTRVRPFPPLSD